MMRSNKVMDQTVKIGEYEFVTSPGTVLRRKVRSMSWATPVTVFIILAQAIGYGLGRDWFHVGIYTFALMLATYGIYRGLTDPQDQTELIVERDGRWIVRGEDAGEVDGAFVSVKTSRGRHLVLLSCRDRDKPHLVWWTVKRRDAERLRNVIETVLPTRAGSGVWPPAPVYRADE